jgi:ABC-type transport system involved in multi-copper enzyme maturation permease subunit
MVVAVVFLFIPFISSLSMRQVTELSITLSLSLISFILLLLSVFLGATSLWKDMERRYTFSVLGLPISRSSYLLGRFAGNALFLLLTAAFLGIIAIAVIGFAQGIYPTPRPVQWQTIGLAILFDAFKYILLIAVAFLLSTVSTSFFLPIFGTISLYFVGSSSQAAYDYLHSGSGAIQQISPVVVKAATVLYYLIPNLEAFTLHLQAIYGLPVDAAGLWLTTIYFGVYTAIVMAIAAIVFNRREMM